MLIKARRRPRRTNIAWLSVPILSLAAAFVGWKSSTAKPSWPPVVPPNYIRPTPRYPPPSRPLPRTAVPCSMRAPFNLAVRFCQPLSSCPTRRPRHLSCAVFPNRSFSRGLIYDFVLTGDWRTDANVSVAFIAEAGLDWWVRAAFAPQPAQPRRAAMVLRTQPLHF